MAHPAFRRVLGCGCHAADLRAYVSASTQLIFLRGPRCLSVFFSEGFFRRPLLQTLMPQRASNRRRRGRRRKEGPFALQLKRPLRLVVRRHRRRRGAELVEVRDLRWPRQAGSQAQGERRWGAYRCGTKKRGSATHSATARANRNLSSRTFTSSLPAITHDLSSMKRSRTSRTCAQKSKGGQKGQGRSEGGGRGAAQQAGCAPACRGGSGASLPSPARARAPRALTRSASSMRCASGDAFDFLSRADCRASRYRRRAGQGERCRSACRARRGRNCHRRTHLRRHAVDGSVAASLNKVSWNSSVDDISKTQRPCCESNAQAGRQKRRARGEMRAARRAARETTCREPALRSE